jgi:hypothetical protein
MGSARLWLDKQLLIDAAEPHPMRVDNTPTLHLAGGQPHALRIEYASTRHANFIESGDIQLGWTHPAEVYPPAIREAVALAETVDVAIVFARAFESEQRDRASLTLPNDQDQLIPAVAAATRSAFRPVRRSRRSRSSTCWPRSARTASTSTTTT